MWYVSINLSNNTTKYLTLNSSGNNQFNLFLCDTSSTVPPGVQNPIVVNSGGSASTTYNVTESVLLTIAWSLNNDSDWVITPTVQGSTEYAVTGYTEPSSGPSETNKDWYTTFTLTIANS